MRVERNSKRRVFRKESGRGSAAAASRLKWPPCAVCKRPLGVLVRSGMERPKFGAPYIRRYYEHCGKTVVTVERIWAGGKPSKTAGTAGPAERDAENKALSVELECARADLAAMRALGPCRKHPMACWSREMESEKAHCSACEQEEAAVERAIKTFRDAIKNAKADVLVEVR